MGAGHVVPQYWRGEKPKVGKNEDSKESVASTRTLYPLAKLQPYRKKSGKGGSEYIKMFWVGLMDGDGSIQVNHLRYQSLQYKIGRASCRERV